ncbi:GcrA family cell cycle regulator [uncultured Albimonas sp.]|uniref:GcrA family cell cycle regulator n=1 Tax=uncultured Albimonas sp. TaxID=1331701 RepID=UPI0030ED1018
MSWTDERVELLKSMWGEGKSASQIAKALGGVTRNAVIGKVHRLGLSNRTAAPKTGGKEEDAAPAPAAAAAAAPRPAPAPEPAPRPTAAAAPEPEPAPRPAPAPQPAPAPRAAAPVPEEPVERPAPRAFAPTPHNGPQPPQVSEVSEEARRNLEEVEKKAKRLNLLQLTERTCKWPIGDPATDDFFFCGLPAIGGKPYCEAHVQVAFQPMSARRDRSRSR